MIFNVVIDPRAINDIQEAIYYYNERQKGLGNRFEEALNKQINLLEKKPYFQVRYDNIRCFPMQKFPFMVHFLLDEKAHQITILGVFHTAIDPNKWRSIEKP
jgi:toxin ParE1/3/4